MISIRTKVIVLVTATVLVISLSLGIVSCVLNFQTSMDVMEETLTDTASVAAAQAAEAIRGKLNVAAETGSVARFTSTTVSLEDKRALIEQKIKTYDFSTGGILGPDGKSIFDPEVDMSGEEAFKAAMRGETYVKDSVLDQQTGKLSILLAAPLWKGGIPGTEAVGMVYFMPKPDFLNNIVNSITIGQNGTAYIINKQGTTIAYNDDQIVQDQYNTQEEAKKDPSLAPLAALEARMMQGETGFGQYSYGGLTKVMAFSPLAGSDGWSITVCAGRNEFLGGVYRSVAITGGLVAVFLVVGIALSIVSGGRIAKPIGQCAERLELLARGDLQSPVPDIKYMDETGKLAKATAAMTASLGQIVGDMGWCLGKIADGDFTVESRNKEYYIGDYRPLLEAQQQIIAQLSDALSQVNEAAEQVSGGADQVSAGSQALSQGATEQASSVEELAATINEISSQIRETAKDVLAARDEMTKSGGEVANCNQQMQEMIAAMEEINQKSGEIGKIIKTIEDIAFQTNILALNAAVEAARAGEAGKGFAVVADEVRSLASKSGEASKDTSVLIEGSIQAIEKGAQIASETAQSLLRVVEDTKSVSASVDKIAEAANEEAASIDQVTLGIDQISSVVQTNSATAEESAAASQVLSGQAQMLKELVEKFRLRDK